MSLSERIVVGVSGTPTSLQALRAAVVEARCSGSMLVAVLARTPPGGETAHVAATHPSLLQIC
jgi:hypothetical protein